MAMLEVLVRPASGAPLSGPGDVIARAQKATPKNFTVNWRGGDVYLLMSRTLDETDVLSMKSYGLEAEIVDTCIDCGAIQKDIYSACGNCEEAMRAVNPSRFAKEESFQELEAWSILLWIREILAMLSRKVQRGRNAVRSWRTAITTNL